jgi:glycerophosphoryl diester phosphodiesterase
MTAAPPLLIAHRGASYKAPENTLPSFLLAWEEEADGIETDIHLTRDGRLACIHDADTHRITGTKHVVAESTLADLQALDAGSWKGPEWTGARIPALEEVLATVPLGKFAYIEIKCAPSAVPVLEAVLHGCDFPHDQTVLMSFDAETASRCKQTLPQCKVLWLAHVQENPDTGRPEPQPKTILDILSDTHADGAGLRGATPEIAAALHQAGRELHVWTVNDPAQLPALLAMGVSAITTDHPAALREALNRLPPVN